MAFTVGAIAAKDGAAATIVGGLLAADTVGGGAGPWFLYHGLVDGVAGSNKANVTASNALKVDGSAVTQPVSIATAPVLVTGAAVIGKVGIDQTTDLTTNKMRAFIHDGTTALPVLAASSGAPAATSPALPVSLRDMLPPGSAASTGSAPVVVANDQATQAVAYDTSQILNGKSGVGLTPSTAKINISTATTTTVIALVASKKIRILACYLIIGGAGNVNWQSHTTTSNGDAALDLAANGGFVLPFNPLGWFDTTVGEALDIVTSAGVQVSGRIVYVAV